MKVLFVLYQRFDQIPDGGDLCNKRNLTMVNSICGDDNVDIYYLRSKKRNSIIEAVEFLLYMYFGFYRGITPRKVSEICKIAPKYDCVFLSSSLFGIIAYKLKQSGYKGRIVSQFHNVETQYYSCVLPHNLPLRKSIINCINKNELDACNYSDIKLALNKRDKEAIDKLSDRPIDFVLPITLGDKVGNINDDAMTGIPPLVLFIGSNFPPNAEGVLWFVDKVLPFVNIRFKIVGKDMDLLKKNNSSLADVEVLSNVPDLADYFREADLIVAPIFSGSGMKVKTCEALMYGKNILGTKESFEGYNLDFDKVGKLANTAQDFIDYLKELCQTPIPRYNTYSREMYLTYYSNDAARTVFEEFLG